MEWLTIVSTTQTEWKRLKKYNVYSLSRQVLRYELWLSFEETRNVKKQKRFEKKPPNK